MERTDLCCDIDAHCIVRSWTLPSDRHTTSLYFGSIGHLGGKCLQLLVKGKKRRSTEAEFRGEPTTVMWRLNWVTYAVIWFYN